MNEDKTLSKETRNPACVQVLLPRILYIDGPKARQIITLLSVEKYQEILKIEQNKNLPKNFKGYFGFY